jgi:hypothetical protein
MGFIEGQIAIAAGVLDGVMDGAGVSVSVGSGVGGGVGVNMGVDEAGCALKVGEGMDEATSVGGDWVESMVA